MTEQCKRQLHEAGVDLDRTLERFMGNEAMYEKFLYKFAADQTMPALTEALTAGSAGDAELAAHTLKGVAANLGLDPLAQALDQIVQQLRAGQSCGEVAGLLTRTEGLYQRFCEIISRM